MAERPARETASDRLIRKTEGLEFESILLPGDPEDEAKPGIQSARPAYEPLRHDPRPLDQLEPHALFMNPADPTNYYQHRLRGSGETAFIEFMEYRGEKHPVTRNTLSARERDHRNYEWGREKGREEGRKWAEAEIARLTTDLGEARRQTETLNTRVGELEAQLEAQKQEIAQLSELLQKAREEIARLTAIVAGGAAGETPPPTPEAGTAAAAGAETPPPTDGAGPAGTGTPPTGEGAGAAADAEATAAAAGAAATPTPEPTVPVLPVDEPQPNWFRRTAARLGFGRRNRTVYERDADGNYTEVETGRSIGGLALFGAGFAVLGAAAWELYESYRFGHGGSGREFRQHAQDNFAQLKAQIADAENAGKNALGQLHKDAEAINSTLQHLKDVDAGTVHNAAAAHGEAVTHIGAHFNNETFYGNNQDQLVQGMLKVFAHNGYQVHGVTPDRVHAIAESLKAHNLIIGEGRYPDGAHNFIEFGKTVQNVSPPWSGAHGLPAGSGEWRTVMNVARSHGIEFKLAA